MRPACAECELCRGKLKSRMALTKPNLLCDQASRIAKRAHSRRHPPTGACSEFFCSFAQYLALAPNETARCMQEWEYATLKAPSLAQMLIWAPGALKWLPWHYLHQIRVVWAWLPYR